MRVLLPIVVMLLAFAASAQVISTKPGDKRLVIKDGQVVEVFVDEKGDIYKELRYHGIIPNIRDDLRPVDPKTKKPKKKKKRGKKAVITWVGFQPKQFYSRVFIQTDRISRFTLHKPDALHIVATFDQARIPKRNNRRDIITSMFRSAVGHIRTRRRGSKVEVVITLRKPVGYLYKREGNYVFIDVER